MNRSNKILEYFKKNDFGLTLVFLVILFFADYVNIFDFLGLDFSKINLGMWSVLMIFVIFYLSYSYIDSKNRERDELVLNNAVHTNEILVKNVYLECVELIGLIDSKEFEAYVLPKIDFDKTNIEDQMFSYLLNAPFEKENRILESASNGLMSKEEFIRYLDIQKKYKKYVNRAVTFFDRKEMSYKEKLEIISLLNEEVQSE